MCQVNCHEIQEGLIPSEKVAHLKTANGDIEEVIVSQKQVVGTRLVASEIGRDAGKVLIELPRESSSGKWRVWVSENDIG